MCVRACVRACVHECVYIYRVVVVLENYVLVVVNKERNDVRFLSIWHCVAGLRKHLLG